MNRSAILLGLALMSCVPAGRKFPLPLVMPHDERSTIVTDKRFGVAVLDFDATQEGSEKLERAPLNVSIPAMLATELQRDGRFRVFEAGNLRRPISGELIDEEKAKQRVDAYVTGTLVIGRGIDNTAPDQVCFEVRLSSSYSHELLFARSICSALRVQNGTLGVERPGIKQVALEMSQAMARVEPARVIRVSHSEFVIDKGKDDGVRPGMVALLIPTARAADDATAAELVKEYTAVDPSFAPVDERSAVAQAYIVALSQDPHRSLARIFDGEYALAGDTAVFK